MPIHADNNDPWDQRLARIAADLLARASVSPNIVTTVGLFLGILCAMLYGLGGRAADLGAFCFMLASWLDHVDGELARISRRTSRFGHYYDLATGGILLVGLFAGMGYGLREDSLGGYAILLGLAAGVAIAVIFTLRMELEERDGKAAVAQNSVMGFETEDVMYLVGPITWLDGLQPFLVLTAIGAPIYAAYTLWCGRHLLKPGSPSP